MATCETAAFELAGPARKARALSAAKFAVNARPMGDQVRHVIPQEQQPTFKFSREYSWHRALVRPGAGVVAARRVPQINGLLVPPATPSVNCGGGAGNGAWPCRAGCASL